MALERKDEERVGGVTLLNWTSCVGSKRDKIWMINSIGSADQDIESTSSVGVVEDLSYLKGDRGTQSHARTHASARPSLILP